MAESHAPAPSDAVGKHATALTVPELPVDRMQIPRPCCTAIDLGNRLLQLTETNPCILRQHRQHRLRDRYLFTDSSKVGLIASRLATAGSTDGADGVFGICAHPDHSRTRTAFTRENVSSSC